MQTVNARTVARLCALSLSLCIGGSAIAQLRPLPLTLEQVNYLDADLFSGGSDDILTILAPRVVVDAQVGVEAFNVWDSDELEPGNFLAATQDLLPVDSNAKAADLHTLRTMRSMAVISGNDETLREFVVGGRIDNFPNRQAGADISYVAILTIDSVADILGEGASDEVELLNAIENNAVVPADQRILLNGSAGITDSDLDNHMVDSGVLISFDEILEDYNGAHQLEDFSAFLVVLKDHSAFDANNSSTFEITEMALLDSDGPRLLRVGLSVDAQLDVCLRLEFDFPIVEDLLSLYGTDVSSLDDPGSKLRVRDRGTANFPSTLLSEVQNATAADSDPWTAADEGYENAVFDVSDPTKRALLVKLNTDGNAEQAVSIANILTAMEMRPSTGASSGIVGVHGEPAESDFAAIEFESTEAPLLTSPSDGSTNAPTFLELLTFEWVGLDGLASHRLLVSKHPDLSDPVIDAVVSGGSYTPAGGLEKSTRYYWGVEASSASGTAMSEVHEFTTVLTGDVNFDGVVDFSDLNEVLVGFGQEGP